MPPNDLPDAPPVAAPPPPDAPTSGPADYNPAQDDAAGLTAYREARAAHAAEADAPPAPDSPAPPPAATPPGSPTPPDDSGLAPEDAKLARILNRISRLEDERNAAQRTLTERDAELSRLKERAAVADAYDQDFARFREDPEALFRKVKWDRKTIEDYIAHGPSKVDAATAVQERKTQDLEARLAKFEQAEAERTRQTRIDQYKTSLPAQLAGKEDQYPLLHSFYEAPHERADALFGVMAEAYRSQNREMPVEEAAKLLESTLTTHLERLSRPRSKPAPGTGSIPASAPKPPTPSPTLTNSPPAAATPPRPDPESDDDLLQLAAASLRKQRRPAV